MQRSAAQVLEAVAAEMAALAEAAERLQSMTGGWSQGDTVMIEEAQGLDALAQGLDALAAFLARVGQDMPAGWELDIAAALAAVPLTDLATRIGHPVAVPSQAVAPTGDCELF
jgi:hypothetical protein